MKHYRYIFVVLVYKNIDVLRDFFHSLTIEDKRVVIVNSFFDEESLRDCETVAKQNEADFISIPNKGYGYGNNVGTKYVMEHYIYDYLILSNSDIQIKNFLFLKKTISDAEVIAPYTHLLSGKKQNPNIPWYIPWLIPLHYMAYKFNSRLLLHIPHALSRLQRDFFYFFLKIVKKETYRIYSCHGSFIVFTKAAVDKLFPLFNEKMFLYNEELFLAERCRLEKVPVYFCPQLDVLHLEGASSSSDKKVGFKYNKDSFLILYNWLRNIHEVR